MDLEQFIIRICNILLHVDVINSSHFKAQVLKTEIQPSKNWVLDACPPHLHSQVRILLVVIGCWSHSKHLHGQLKIYHAGTAFSATTSKQTQVPCSFPLSIFLLFCESWEHNTTNVKPFEGNDTSLYLILPLKSMEQDAFNFGRILLLDIYDRQGASNPVKIAYTESSY